MEIKEIGTGAKIDYEIRDTKITFDDELMLNLAKYERDDPVHLDICKDAFGSLCMGLAENYVAQIDIPARSYDETENGEDDQGNLRMVREAKKFDMSNCTLTLWEVE